MTSSRPSARKIGTTCVIAISLLQFWQISIIGTIEQASLVLMTFLWPDKRGAREKAHPGSGACQSEKQELRNWPDRFTTAARSPILCADHPTESRQMIGTDRACRPTGMGLCERECPLHSALH